MIGSTGLEAEDCPSESMNVRMSVTVDRIDPPPSNAGTFHGGAGCNCSVWPEASRVRISDEERRTVLVNLSGVVSRSRSRAS